MKLVQRYGKLTMRIISEYLETEKGIKARLMKPLSGCDNKNRKMYRPFQVFQAEYGLWVLDVMAGKNLHPLYLCNAFKRVVYLGGNRILVIEDHETTTIKGLMGIASSLRIVSYKEIYLLIDVNTPVHGQKVSEPYACFTQHKLVPDSEEILIKSIIGNSPIHFVAHCL